jgi:spore coat protein CotH
MAESDWATLRANYLSNTDYDATVTFDGETIADCTIRSRGSGTRNGIKPGLRVDFSRKVKSQRFHGFKRLVVDNMYHDASFLHEQLAFAVFEELGILVPRESYARLTVNGQYWGLYAIIEPIDEVFVASHVDGGDGNLFEYNVPPVSPDQLLAWDFTLSRGETIDDYVPEPFEPKTHEDDLDGTALLAFIRTVTEAPAETFTADISQFIDPQVLLTYYAVEVATAELDGLTSPFGVNNFYLYQLQGQSRFQFIPWDHDFNFASPNHLIYYGAERNRLIRRLLSDPELKELYETTLQSIIAQFVNPSWMTPLIESRLALIRESVLQDTKRIGGDDPATSVQRFDDAVAQVQGVIAARAASVDAQMQAGRRRAVRH